MISPSDWVFIVCTLILATIALFGPYINELWKRKRFAPKLKIIFYKKRPYIVLPSPECIYLFCFEVKNEGNSKAKNCEVIIEEFCYKSEKGNLIKDIINFPAKLKWTVSSYSPIDILPKTGKFFNIFSINESNEIRYRNKLRLTIHTEPIVGYALSTMIVPLNYLKIKIVIYSENAEKCEQYIEIKSPGIMREKKEQILQEMQITLS